MADKKNKRISYFILALIVLFSMFPAFVFAETDNPTFTTGDYIQMGKYQGQDIQWRVIGFGDGGQPLLISAEILDYKAYDAYNLDMDDFNIQKCWSKSAIRTWLNSAEEGKAVPYLDIDGGISNLNNPHTWEWDNGFLHPDNFTQEEVQMMSPAVVRSTLPERYLKLKSGGEELFMGDEYNLYEILDNYQRGYYEETIDRVFLINVLQFTEMYEQLGAFAYGKLSLACEKSLPIEIAREIQREDTDNPFYLLRDTATFTHQSLNKVGPLQTAINSPNNWQKANTELPVLSGVIGDGSAYAGIRPAFYLKTDSVAVVSGQGLPKDPYVLILDTKTAAPFSYEISSEEPLVTPVSNLIPDTSNANSKTPMSTIIALVAMAIISVVIVVFVAATARNHAKGERTMGELEQSYTDEYYRS